jgi:hypothetical protein
MIVPLLPVTEQPEQLDTVERGTFVAKAILIGSHGSPVSQPQIENKAFIGFVW